MCGAFDKCDQDSVMIPIFIKRKRSFKSNDLEMIYVFFCMKNTNSLAKNVGCRSCDELKGF